MAKGKLVCCRFCGRDTTNASGYCYQHDFQIPYKEHSDDEDEPRTTQEEYNGETVRDDI